MFKANMANIMRTNNKHVSGAFKIFSHKNEFVDKTIVGAENLIQSIKAEDQDLYKTFRKEVQGWNKKLDMSNFSYVKGHYRYTRVVDDVEKT